VVFLDVRETPRYASSVNALSRGLMS